MAKLYPPNIGGTIPAFYSVGTTTKIVVPFSMNKAVGKSEVFGFSLKIKYVDGNIIDTFQVFDSSLIIKNDDDSFNIDFRGSYDLEKSLTVTFNVNSIKGTYLKEGQFYKVQLAYIDKNLEVGYYSTVGIVKYTIRPTVEIANLEDSPVNPHRYSYTGVYSQYKRDPTEKIYSSRFLLTHSDGTIIKDTGYVLHNSSEDDLPYESRETFLWARDLDPNTTYFLKYIVKTINGLECESPSYRISQFRSVGTEVNLNLSAELNYENGYIGLKLICDEPIISGTFLLSRACSKDDYQWAEIKRFDVQSLIPSEWSYFDCTLEQGYFYKYSLQQYNANDIYSNRVISNLVYADFEHAFLYDGNQQFKISFDPKITNFKNNILENKVDTIGNKYPFILRNGNVNYKSFDIQGLISLQTDTEGLFLDTSLYETDDIITDLTSKNIAAERYFKRSVQDWLNNGKPKLFRSPTEGNFIVRLLNVSLTPNDKLGRMIHSFKATAYEIGAFNTENLEKYNIIDTSENLTTLTRWTTVNLKDFCEEYVFNALKSQINSKEKYTHELFKDMMNQIPNEVINFAKDNWRSINSSRKIYSIKIQDCEPGTIVRIDDIDIMIGATGAYIAESADGFGSIQICLSNYLEENYSYPIITYSYQTKAVSIFGSITKVNIEDIPLEQWIGTSTQTNILELLNDTRTTVSSLGLIRFKKRDIYQVFVDCSDPSLFTPNSEWEYYEDEKLTKKIDNTKMSKIGIYQIRCKRTDYRNYPSEGYYTDKTMKNLAPFTDYFLDGKTKTIHVIHKDLFAIVLNNSEKIDLKEIEKYQVQDINAVSSILINQGIIAEISYSRQISTYAFDNNSHSGTLKVKFENYENAKTAFHDQLISSIERIGMMSDNECLNYLNNLDAKSKNVQLTYKEAIAELNNAILEYKETHGLL